MTTNIFATAVALSDQDLLARIDALACRERDASVELVAHIAALELRPSLYAPQGYGSLFAYCTQALRLSEDAACNRIDAARVCRRFPAVLDLLAAGSISLSTIRLLKPHLTAENQEAVFARATHRTRKEIEALVAELAPRPDVAASVRRVPNMRSCRTAIAAGAPASAPRPAGDDMASPAPSPTIPLTTASSVPFTSPPEREARGSSVSSPSVRTAHRPIIQTLAPQRYRVQFTIGQEAHDDLRRVQALLRREIPSGDVGAIFEQGLRLLREKVEKAKLGAATRPRSKRVIRPGTDKPAQSPCDPAAADSRLERRVSPSRHIPNEVRRAVWRRDAGQCAFVSGGGHRCSERSFLELHHIHPFALDGPPTVGNISLRCRRHNRYEAELVFGSRVGGIGEAGPMK